MVGAGRARGSLALASLLAGCMPELDDGPARPGAGWPDLGDPPAGMRDGSGDAALIVALDDPELGGRAGAWAVASGWWRYLVETRGLRPARVTILRDDEATEAALDRGLRRLEDRAQPGSMLWLVFIGSGISRDADDGLLLLAGGGHESVARLRTRLGFGYHESALVILDACAESPPPSWRAGVPAGIDHPLRAVSRSSGPPPSSRASSGAPTTLEQAVADTRARVMADAARERSSPRNLFVVTAGTGEACGDRLAGREWPALSYAALAALQGWADANEDGWVSALELTIFAQAMLAKLDELEPDEPPAPARLEASGVDLILADLAGRGPSAPKPARARTEVAPLDPAAASQTDDALVRARSLVAVALEDMVAVPPGSFEMGCDPGRDDDCEDDETPIHVVGLGGYAIDRLEVRWADYRACVDTGACTPARLRDCYVWNGAQFVYGGELSPASLADDHPAVCVTWDEARSYCRALGKRLPTEAEWERAARGLDGRIYPWGDAPPSCRYATIHGCSDFSLPVGSKPAGASPVGALDMAGNVAEWVFDWWGERSYRGAGSRDDPTGPSNGRVRGVRGGSFYNGGVDLRSSYRYAVEPDTRMSIVGFRCAR